MAFTKEQLEAINRDGTNIIVSAGAGSGKTAVLTERVIRKLKDGININNLLVLTFTNEAANEMKSRIRAAIIKNGLNDQLDLLESSYITTFDSFALSLVKKYHYILNIDRNMGIISEGIITLRKHEYLDNIMEEKYGREEYLKLFDEYCFKDDKQLKEFILEVDKSIAIIPNSSEYIEHYMDNFYNDSYLDEIINKYVLLIKREIVKLRGLYDQIGNYATDNLCNNIFTWFKPLFEGNSYTDYKLFTTLKAPRFTGLQEDGIELKEEIKDSASKITEWLRFKDEREIKEIILKGYDKASLIINIIQELDTFIDNYKREINMYEFNDIAKMALGIVRDNLSIREEIKHSFNEIMVDEYQDTSDIQEAFIGYISQDNVYMVGDIKQSIYRFRNANPYIFGTKYQEYSQGNGGIKIDLLKNFRSRKETLQNINEIFNLIMDEEIGNANYLESHNMVYGNTLYDLEDSLHNNYLEVYNYEMDEGDIYSKEEKEIFIIAEDITNKIKNKYLVFDKETAKLRPIKYSDICIITDRKKYFELYKKVLEYKEIPSMLYMDYELNYDTVYMVCVNLLELTYLVSVNDYSDRFRYDFTSVARSFIGNYDDQLIYQILKDKSYFQDEIVNLAKKIDLNKALPDILNMLLEEFKVYQKLTKLNDIEANMVRISNLIDMAYGLNEIGYSVSEFIAYLRKMEELKLPVTYSTKKGNVDAVKIMNIHKSKGLEFSLCYFTGMHNKFTISEVTSKFIFNKKYGLILPYLLDIELNNDILKDLYKDDYYHEEISEKIRLFYVALTRCREKMIILSCLNLEKTKYSHLVPDSVRMKYRSFLDILDSLAIIDKYTVLKQANCTKEYNKIKIKEIEKVKITDRINKHLVNVNYDMYQEEHFSKEIKELIDIDQAKALRKGTQLHQMMEYDDFSNPQSKYVINLLKQLPKDIKKVYHEYEFIYDNEFKQYHGIIDLLVEYDKMFYIIDYKTKDITSLEYIKQLNGYRDYLKRITAKEIKVFLYSLYDDKLEEV